MTWSGGTYTRPGGSTAWGDDRDASTEIEAGLHDTHDEDLAQGINDCLHKGGQNSATADISMGGNKLTSVGTPTADNDAANKAYVDSAFVTGGIVPYTSTTPPSGWLLCDGSAVSRVTYADLFAVISTTFGAGDGSTTFNLPDLAGRVIAGYSASGSRLTSPNQQTNAATGGSQTSTHNHGNGSLSTGSGPTHTTAAAGSGVFAVGSNGHTHTINGSTANDSPSVVQPTMILPYIIKT